MSTLNAYSSARGSVESVLEDLIRTSDLNYVASVPPGEFERLLVEEVENTGAFPRHEHENVRRHIHEHVLELYGYAMRLSLAAMQHHIEEVLTKAKRLLDTYQAAVSEKSGKSGVNW